MDNSAVKLADILLMEGDEAEVLLLPSQASILMVLVGIMRNNPLQFVNDIDEVGFQLFLDYCDDIVFRLSRINP